MKGIVKDFVTPEEANQLRSLTQNKSVVIQDLPDGGIRSLIVNRLKEDIPDLKIHDKSYLRIEHIYKGHGWHVDTGSNNHMPWCTYGCSIMLSRDYEYVGGTFHYRDEDLEPDFCQLIWHDSKTEHMVEPHQGVRVVCLIFI